MQKQIADLEARLNVLVQRHNESRKEIAALKEDLKKLKNGEQLSISQSPAKKDESISAPKVVETSPIPTSLPTVAEKKSQKAEDKKRNIEEFIGGKLINFIGIGILVLGVSMGIKYAIDHSLVGPLFRVLLGYAVGIGLVFLAWRLKAKYLFYSAVMLGGGVSILYFDTYAAFEYYQLLPYLLAFLLMLIITAFTIWAAVLYDLQVIGIIGLVGAYAIPILLSQESGRMHIFFSYMAIINTGILILAFRKNWRLLNYCAFTLTWMIFITWSIFTSSAKDHNLTVISFAGLFFLIFYTSFLAYKLIHFEKFNRKDVILMLFNAFIFYGVGYDWLYALENGEAWLGLFTLGHAAIHSGVSMFIYARKQADRNVFYLIMSLALAFVAIAIPVQLDGNWVTLLWLFMGVGLFCIGHFREVHFYKSIAYGVIGLCFLSLLHDWHEAYPQDRKQLDTPLSVIFNMTFYTSVLVVGGLVSIFTFQRLKTSETHSRLQKNIEDYGIPALLLIVAFLSLFLEIGQYGYDQYYASQQNIDGSTQFNFYLLDFRYIWLVIYSLAFLSGATVLNQYQLKSSSFAKILTIGGVIALIAYTIPGTGILNHLRDAFLLSEDNSTAIFAHDWRHIGIRYLTYVFAGGWLYFIGSQIKLSGWWETKKSPWILGFHLVILITLSSELVNIILLIGEQAAENLAYKVGLSILWTAYAIGLITLGIKRKTPVLRYAAFVLIGITLIKVFFFDLSNTPTINRIMIFIGLGALLMLGAYVYQRYREEL